MATTKRVFVAGHNGLVGRALVRKLSKLEGVSLVLVDRNELDLCHQDAVKDFFNRTEIDEVYLAAAKVGGILANTKYPADFIYQNIQIATNVIHYAHKSNIQRLIYLGSSCIYPRDTAQPIAEKQLLEGVLESTNEPYAIAKIAGIKLCESYNRQFSRDYRCVMPTNLYGPFDNFDEFDSHVIPALIRKISTAAMNGAPSVSIWGSGKVKRDFLHVDDLAAGVIAIQAISKAKYDKITQPQLSHINLGSGNDISIRSLARLIADLCGFRGELIFDSEKPEGTPLKLLDCSIASSLGWKPSISLNEGLNATIQWYMKHLSIDS